MVSVQPLNTRREKNGERQSIRQRDRKTNRKVGWTNWCADEWTHKLADGSEMLG